MSYQTAQWGFTRDGEAFNFSMGLDPADFTQKLILDYFERSEFYEPDISRLMISVLKKGDVVFDVGANCGYFTALAATLVGRSGQVVAIEPASECLARLRSNIAANSFENVTVIDRVATRHVGEATFYVNSDNSGGHALWDPAEFPGNEKSRAKPTALLKPATTLDRIRIERNLPVPKLIKIDTEGAEQLVLEGARELISGCKVPFIAAELHEFGLAKLGCTQQSVRGLMENLGYSTFGMYFSGAMPKLVPAGARIRTEFLVNVLFATPASIAEYWPIADLDPRSPL